VAMVIDAWRAVGLEGMAQVDLDEHRNRHQPLSALSGMALTVLATIARRLEQDGRLTVGAGPDEDGCEATGDAAPVERPPLASVGVARAAG
jgi:hypothetical protein